MIEKAINVKIMFERNETMKPSLDQVTGTHNMRKQSLDARADL